MTHDDRATTPRRLERARIAVGRVFGGRYSQGAWVVSTVAYLAALALLMVPPSTYLWTSPQPLKDLYWAFALGVALCATTGLCLAYAKRLQDQNLVGLWALVPLVAVPWILIWTASTWANHIWKPERPVSATDYINIASVGALALIIVIGVRKPRDSIRFGSRILSTDVLNVRHPATLLLSIVVGALVVVSLYAGFVQSGIWIGRKETGYDTGTASSPAGGGYAFATCGGAKGVSAIAQQGQQGGLVRDAISGTWSIVRLPDGSLDIQTFGKNGNVSYREDGFSIQTKGLQLNDIGWVAAGIDKFQILAVAENAASDVSSVTTISFVKQEFAYQAIISSSRVLGRNALLSSLSGGHPRASNFLMIADCHLYQEEAPAKR